MNKNEIEVKFEEEPKANPYRKGWLYWAGEVIFVLLFCAIFEDTKIALVLALVLVSFEYRHYQVLAQLEDIKRQISSR